MNDTMVLTKDEDMIISAVKEHGTSIIQDVEQVDLLINGLLKVGESTYKVIFDAIEKDSRLCKEIAKRSFDLADETIKSNNENTAKVIEAYKDNSEAIRQLLKDPDNPNISISEVFDELRYYAQLMDETNKRNMEANETISNRAKDTETIILARSKKNRNLTIGMGGITLAGIIAFALFHKVLPAGSIIKKL